MTGKPLLFRAVDLPVPGKLHLHSMPGRREPFEQVLAAVAKCRIARIVCLAPMDEVQELSPAYFRAIEQGPPWIQEYYPITDRGIPGKLPSYIALARRIGESLRGGENVLVHCAAGIGRTGTFAMAVALDLGLMPETARNAVQAAGSWPETSAQEGLISALGR